MYEIIIRKKAYAEAQQAFDYYEEKQAGLGKKFLDVLAEQLILLSKRPELYSYIFGDKQQNFRDVKLKGFPYVVIFSIHGSKVVVYKVHNTYSKPSL